MLHQRIPGDQPATSDDALAQAILSLLTNDHAGLVSLAELACLLTPSGQLDPGTEPPRHPTADAIETLYAAGLLHRIGQFVFATRAAHEAQRLAG